jgi:hypothetical protein
VPKEEQITRTVTTKYVLCWVPETYTDGATGIEVANFSSLADAGYLFVGQTFKTREFLPST